MNFPDIIIAVDGCSSTGKSTFAKMAAARYGFLYLDSGALYRGVTLLALESGLIASDGKIDEAGLQARLEQGVDLHFRRDDGASRLFMGERCIEKEIRTLQVSGYVSPIAALPWVRSFVDEKLHAFARGGRVIMDGRDIGTTVFPNAEVKVFMTASAEVRAQRRFEELQLKGENPTFEAVMENLQQRDYIDSHRAVSPLVQAPDAYVLDNSDLTLEQEVAWLQGLVQGKFDIRE